LHGARTGREQLWELKTARLQKAGGCLDQISVQWDAALRRLQAFVEKQELS
jgi:hypothetical protein